MIKTCEPEWLLADIMVECPDAPEALIMRSIMRAARDFSTVCMHECWIDIPTQENVQHYPFERHLPEGFGVEYVTDVKFRGCCLECVDDGCNSRCSSGYQLDDMNQISLVGYCPSGDECDNLQVKVTLKILPTACELPCDMLEKYEEELKAGALAYLTSMKGRKWSDLQASAFYQNMFLGGMASAKCDQAAKTRQGQMVIPGECLI